MNNDSTPTEEHTADKSMNHEEEAMDIYSHMT